MLRQFLDSFGFEYEFKSSTQYYQSGFFDPYLKNVLRHYDAIMQVMLPSLREERRKTYSPFLPICPQTNEVLQVPIEHYCLQKNTITYKDPVSNDLMTLPITGGHCKLQWKVDWGMRWSAFDVDYEMSGKDLIDSVKLSSKICRIIGGHVPQTLTYELFLDQKGEKISKSKGNGLSIDEWLTYAPQESLAYYMFQSPKKAKRLYFDVIPKACDEYLNHRANFAQASIDQASQASDASTGEVSDASIGQERFDTPIWHIHHQDTINHENSLSFSILLNLASVCNTQDPEVLWGFVKRYLPSATPTTMPLTDRLIQHAVQYFISFVKPYKQYRQPNPNEIVALHALHDRLKSLLSPNHLAPSANDIQHIVYEVGKLNNFSDLRTWFGTLYEVLLGQTDGPRIGSFIHLYGVEEFCALIRQHIN
jgi:lysyl-tRNA synthetase class 1